MPADASIYSGLLQQPRSALDYQNEYAKADALRGQNALQQLSLRQASQADEERNSLRAFLRGGADLTSAEGIAGGYAAAPTQFGPIAKSFQDRVTSQANANQANAVAAKDTQETLMSKRAQHFSDLATVNTPEDALAWGADGVRLGIISPDKFPAAIQALQQAAQTPQGFAQWKQQAMANAMTAQEQLKQQAAAPTEVRLGNVVKMIDMNPHSATFGKEVGAAQPIGVSPDTVATQAGENARAAQSRATQLRLGGYDANGNLLDLGLGGAPAAPGAAPAKTGSAASPLAGLVDSIGTYKSPESVALGRVPPALKSQVLAAVMQKYPDYDPSTFGAKQKAARDFATGAQGNAMRSFAVAGQHLDQLDPLIAQLDNGDNHTINQLGNAIAKWNGGTPVTDFNAAKEVVGKEVIKAIVGSGGGVEERQELARQLSEANSPQQLRGVVKQYRTLMAAQHDALHAQRLGAGLPDSTMPNYGDAGTAGKAAGDGWKILGVH